MASNVEKVSQDLKMTKVFGQIAIKILYIVIVKN